MPGKYLSGWVAGLAENIANSAQLKLEFGLSLAKMNHNMIENESNPVIGAPFFAA